ncbi:Alkali-sensitive linkage protein 1 [Tolypocladium capitatum]|uniref:Alkali-sensitive linkage protein 1 n=1 Tax=Tolypocladium capitatum TaxID=45235 RepID=A0A2K3QFR8_9HYPO|nr:Alkali-sensitive linkage protein 1 [Tolypocladium capitatum]
MITLRFFAALLAVAGIGSAASSKRGLCFTPNEAHPDDNHVWVKSGSDLKWYYNYQGLPSPAYSPLSQDDFEYIPMMWGVGSNPNDTAFYDQVKKLVDDGTKVKHVLGFNEPDGPADQGGSNIKPKDAAQAWVANFEPLGKMGIKLGLPACTGSPGGLPWLKQFLGNCSELVSTGGDKKNCTWGFLPVHWYDNFAGLASHIGERKATWPDAEIWVTEYAYAHQGLAPSQEFYNQSIDYFEKLDYIGRYAYFGAFRASKANVGSNAAMLSNGGKLTDIGSWYLGFSATGVTPQSGKGAMTVPSVVLVGAGVSVGLAVNLF